MDDNLKFFIEPCLHEAINTKSLLQLHEWFWPDSKCNSANLIG